MAETAEERVRAMLDTAKRQGFSMVNRVDAEDLSALLARVERLEGALKESSSFLHIMLASPFWAAAVDPVREEVSELRVKVVAALAPNPEGRP